MSRPDNSPATPARNPGLLDTPGFWYAAFVVMLAITQIGAMGQEVIDWDESTFILMGADVAKGHLPYVELFDIKPPMMFLMLGGVIALFGKSLIAIRVFGDLCLLAATIGCFALAKARTDVRSAGLASLLVLAMASNEFAQYTSTELPAVAFLMGSLVLAALHPRSLYAAAGSGLLVSLAILTRSNLAPVAIMLGVYYLAAAVLRTHSVPRLAVLAYGLAGSIPPLVIVTVYAVAGHLDVLILSVVDVSLAYATGQMSMIAALQSHVQQYIVSTSFAPGIFIPFTLIAAGGMAVSLFALVTRRPKAIDRRVEWLLWAMLATVGLSVLSGGAAYAHYWMQLLPLLGVFAAVGLDGLAKLGTVPKWAGRGAALVGIAVAVAMTGGSALKIVGDPASVQRDHAIRAAADDIVAASPGASGRSVWAIHNHLIHWYLDAPLPSRIATHPDNIVRAPIIDTMAAAGYVAPDEMARIWRSHPDFIVMDAERSTAYLTDNGYDLPGYLATDYRLLARRGTVLVYQRLR